MKKLILVFLVMFASTAQGQLLLRDDKGSALTWDELDGNFAFQVSQTSHGFSVGDLIYINGSSELTAAIATAESTLAVAVVAYVEDANTAWIQSKPHPVTVTSHGFTVGARLYLSQSSAGDATTTKPSSGLVQPVGWVFDANTIIYTIGPTEGGGTATLEKNTALSNPNDADNFLRWRFDAAFTVDNIYCIVDPADSSESVVLALYESDANGDFTDLSTNGLDGTTTITCDNDGATDDGTLSNAAIAADRWVGIDIGTVTGTVTNLTINFVGSYD